MANFISHAPLFLQNRPWWLSLLMLLITLHGILILKWNLQPIVFLFWWEVILLVSASLIRMLFAMNSEPFRKTLLSKIGLLIGGVFLGGTFIIFSVIFTFTVFKDGGDYKSLSNISVQKNMMTLSYIIGLVVPYFANGNYKKANPIVEIILPFLHLLVLLAFLQVLTMHIIPKYPQLEQAMWIGVSLVVVKFIVEMIFARIKQPFKRVFGIKNGNA